MKNSIEIKKGKLDSANLKNLSGKDQRGNLYNHSALQELKGKSDKEKRGFLRRKLESFRSNILGIDRKKEEREKSLKEFISFYKKFWRIQDFKFESFSNQKDSDFQRDYEKILKDAKIHLEGRKRGKGKKDASKEIINPELIKEEIKG